MASYETYRKQYLRSNDESMKKDIADSDAIYDNQAKTTKEKYGAQIDLSNQEYDDELRANEVQKYINMREVAENNANLGLTDSGLNRTQSTAVQLSASNNAAKIERDRNNMVRSLETEMNRYLTEIENSKISSAASIRKGYESAADEYATTAVKALGDQLSMERIAEINDEIEKIKVSAAKGRKNDDGTLKEGYDIKTVANDAINDYLNYLVKMGEITKSRAITLYKNSAYLNDLYRYEQERDTGDSGSDYTKNLSDYVKGYYENGKVVTKKR